MGVAVDATGALLVADDVGNVIWWVGAVHGAPGNQRTDRPCPRPRLA